MTVRATVGTLDIAREAVSRADTAYVAGCVFRVVLLSAYALHGQAGRWLVDEKGAIASAGRLPAAPPDFTVRAHGVLAHLGDRPDQLQPTITAAQALLDDVRATCKPPHQPIPYGRRDYRHFRRSSATTGLHVGTATGQLRQAALSRQAAGAAVTVEGRQ